MKFTVTPLGGGRGDAARVVDAIARYLQPHPKTPQAPSQGGAAVGGPEQYYADAGEEPGRWLGRTAAGLGLVGAVRREDFAAMLAGRDPFTDERLITAQGSAGRCRHLGAGSHTRVAPNGEQLFAVADAAAVLRVSRLEVERMVGVGAAVAVGSVTDPSAPENGIPVPEGSPVHHPLVTRRSSRLLFDLPFPSPVEPPDKPATRAFAHPEGSYLGPLIDRRWVTVGPGQ